MMSTVTQFRPQLPVGVGDPAYGCHGGLRRIYDHLLVVEFGRLRNESASWRPRNPSDPFRITNCTDFRRSQPIQRDPATSGAIAGATRWAAAARHGLRRVSSWYQEQRAARELQTMSDAMLKDIGVRRCEIPYLARTHAAVWWRA